MERMQAFPFMVISCIIRGKLRQHTPQPRIRAILGWGVLFSLGILIVNYKRFISNYRNHAEILYRKSVGLSWAETCERRELLS